MVPKLSIWFKMPLRPFWLTCKKVNQGSVRKGHSPQAQKVLSLRCLVKKCYYSQFGSIGEK